MNAKAESFIKTLKQEGVDGPSYRDLDRLRQSIAEFLENVYNRQRLQSALGYRSPIEFEETLMPSGAEDSTLMSVGEGVGCPLPPHPQ